MMRTGPLGNHQKQESGVRHGSYLARVKGARTRRLGTSCPPNVNFDVICMVFCVVFVFWLYLMFVRSRRFCVCVGEFCEVDVRCSSIRLLLYAFWSRKIFEVLQCDERWKTEKGRTSMFLDVLRSTRYFPTNILLKSCSSVYQMWMSLLTTQRTQEQHRIWSTQIKE